jgi:endonuclease/exonuclease/phosphatase family metal-dependent hydrolase
MTLNMRGFFEWDERANRIADYIKKENPDIVFFQEVVYLPEESPYTQVSLLNRELKYPYYQGSITRLQESPHYEVYREGLATLSRYPLVSSESIVLKQEEGDPHNRLVQLFDIAIDESIVKFANVHLSVRHDRALHHLQEVFGILEQRHEKRIIIGDFNMEHLERHAHLWRDNYTLSTSLKDYVSFPDEHKTIDYLLVPKEFELEWLRLSDDGLSDHRAIIADVEYRPARLHLVSAL